LIAQQIQMDAAGKLLPRVIARQEGDFPVMNPQKLIIRMLLQIKLLLFQLDSFLGT
jgi:hypothetical protein